MDNSDINKFVQFLQSNETYANQFIKNILQTNYSNEEYWSEILTVMLFSDKKVEKFVLDNFSLFNYKFLIKYGMPLSSTIIDELINLDIFNSDNIDNLLELQHLNIAQIEKYINNNKNIRWDLLQEYQNLTSTFIEKYEDKLDWDLISENQFMELNFLLKNNKKLNWALVVKNHKMQTIMNESFIKLFSDTNIWDNIGWIDNIEVDVILKYNDKLNKKSYKSIIENKDITEEDLKEKLKANNLSDINFQEYLDSKTKTDVGAETDNYTNAELNTNAKI